MHKFSFLLTLVSFSLLAGCGNKSVFQESATSDQRNNKPTTELTDEKPVSQDQTAGSEKSETDVLGAEAQGVDTLGDDGKSEGDTLANEAEDAGVLGTDGMNPADNLGVSATCVGRTVSEIMGMEASKTHSDGDHDHEKVSFNLGWGGDSGHKQKTDLGWGSSSESEGGLIECVDESLLKQGHENFVATLENDKIVKIEAISEIADTTGMDSHEKAKLCEEQVGHSSLMLGSFEKSSSSLMCDGKKCCIQK